MNQTVHNPRSEREILTKKYDQARMNLLLVIILTLVNILLLSFNDDTLILFSASVPYFVVAVGAATQIQAFLIAAYVIAAIILALYLICWILSKEHYGWFVAATVMFVVDTVCMVLLYVSFKDFSGISDALIHILILAYLIAGISAGIKLKKLPAETAPEVVENAAEVLPEETSDIEM